MGKVIKTLTPEELDKLQRMAQRAEELEAQLNELRNGDDPEKKKLQEELQRIREQQKEARISELKAKLESTLREDAKRLNASKFEGIIPNAMLEEALAQVLGSIAQKQFESTVSDEVEGFDLLRQEAKKSLFEALKKKFDILEEMRAKEEASRFSLVPPDQVARLNLLNSDAKAVGQLNEQAYGSDQASKGRQLRQKVFDWLLARTLRSPVYIKGQHILEPYRWLVDPLIAAQRNYEVTLGVSDGHWFSRNGRFYEAMQAPEVRNKLAQLLMEAGEITTDDVFGGKTLSQLPLDVSGVVIAGTWPRLIAAQIAANTGTMDSTTIRIYERQYPRTDEETLRADKHFFGFVTSDNQTTLQTSGTLADGTDASDDGALDRSKGHVPQDVYAYVGQVVDADTTITITGTNAAGQTATASVTIKSTDPVGTIRKFIPTVLGDRFMDVSGVTSSGWTSGAGNGQVGIFTEEPYDAHQPGQPARKAKYKIVHYDITEKQWDIQANMPLSVIEDVRIALSRNVDRGIDLVAQMIQILGDALRDYIDQLIFDKALQNVDENNVLTFDSNAVPEGYIAQSWKAQLGFHTDLLSTIVKTRSGAQPNWMVWSEFDKPYFKNWLSDKLDAFAPEANDPFADGRAQFNLHGMAVYVSENMRVEHILMGSNNQRTGIHYLVYVPFQIFSAQNPTAGFEQVVMLHHRAAVEAANTRALGKLHVKRR